MIKLSPKYYQINAKSTNCRSRQLYKAFYMSHPIFVRLVVDVPVHSINVPDCVKND